MQERKALGNKTVASGELASLSAQLVHLARLALAGRAQDVRLHLRRVARRYQTLLPAFSNEVVALLREAPTRSSPLRRSEAPAVPVDQDSRLQLVRHELSPSLDVEPIFEPSTRSRLGQLVVERRSAEKLLASGLTPTRSVLFTGPPGVGKSLAARWVSRELGLPLLTLDLSAVMSSFLGRTGNNLRFVLDYAKGTECVLLLDELDAIAKRRDDATEVGELKRLVTVLLQEIDDWPSEGLLIAATNHPDLLDPAVWRRFELKVDFHLPEADGVRQAIDIFMGADAARLNGWREILVGALAGASFSDIERELSQVRRGSAVGEAPIETLLGGVVERRLGALSRQERAGLTARLVRDGKMSAREVNKLTGVSRDTIRKALATGKRG